MASVYSNLKFLRFRPQLDALAQGTVAPPVHVRIKPINRCNHKCWYCAYRADNLQLGEEMDLADRIPAGRMFEIVEDLIAMGVKAVTFSGGGEPLLYRELPEVVRRLADGGIKVATLTNGANLKGAMADAFARHGSWVRVSLDGWDEDSYAAARGVRPGEFGRLMDNLHTFADRGSACVLGISFIVGEANAPHLLSALARLKETGVHHVKVSGAVVSNDREANNAYHRKLQPLVSAQLAEAKATLEDDRFSVVDHYHELADRFEKDYRRCGFLQFLTVIGADSCVYTCQDKAYTASGRLGSLDGRRFRDFWFSDENRERMRALDPSAACRHHCVAHHKNIVLSDYLADFGDHGFFV